MHRRVVVKSHRQLVKYIFTYSVNTCISDYTDGYHTHTTTGTPLISSSLLLRRHSYHNNNNITKATTRSMQSTSSSTTSSSHLSSQPSGTSTVCSAIPLPNTIQIATIDPITYHPHLRTVLLKGIDSRGLIFFTNYHSAKGKQLIAHPYIA